LLRTLALVIALAGCATETEVVHTERVDPVTGETVVERTEVEREVDDSGCGGIVSCTVDFAGDVIAFPFKLVGGLFQAIF
jgi:hypothetical protein